LDAWTVAKGESGEDRETATNEGTLSDYAAVVAELVERGEFPAPHPRDIAAYHLDGRQPVLPEVCAQCGAAGPGPLLHIVAAEGVVRLHKECRRFWLAEHPQPNGRAIPCVQIREVSAGTETIQ
jgi:hypothetical protein